MSTLGGLYGLEPFSWAKANKKSIFIDTGDTIVSLSSSSDPVLFFCTEDGSGLLTDEFYFRTADGLSLKPLFRKHTHASNTDLDGGDLFDVEIANADAISINRHGVNKTMFMKIDQTGTGAGVTSESEANNSIYTELAAGTTTDGWAVMIDGGSQFSWSDRAEWRFKAQWSHNGSSGGGFLWRAGVAAEKPGDNSDTSNKSFGIEGCSGLGTNIYIFNCDGGGTRPQTDTETDMRTGTGGTDTNIGIRILYTPSSSVLYQDTTAQEKLVTSNVPSSGFAYSDRLLRYGIKTTNTTSKSMYVWADALYGKRNDSSWVGV